MNEPLDQQIVHNAYKFAFLVKEYPKKKLEELTNLMGLPGIDVNLAIWEAIEEGWILDPAGNAEGDEYVHLGENLPEKWDFGPAVDELASKILTAFNILAKKETDLQWEFLSTWLMGYGARDTLIVLKHLLQAGAIDHYFVADPEDPESVYEFYTLPENRKHLWGAKSFKNQPTEEAPAPVEEDPNADESAESEE